MSNSRDPGDRVCDKTARFFERLGPQERAMLVEAMRDERTFLAASLDDLLAILGALER